MAFRAPVLAGLFLVTSLATLAMPGSGNFVGEILILFGAFEDQLVYGLVASVGVVLAAVYMIRLYQGTMHGRAGPAVESLEIDRVNLAAIVPLAAVIVALGVYPNFVVDRTERDVARSIAKARDAGAQAAAPSQRGNLPLRVLAEDSR
jgi:NADH-quinone oxidoreductase subunit M